MTIHTRVIKFRVMDTMVSKTKMVFQEMIENEIVPTFTYPEDKAGYLDVKVIDELVLPKLDAFADWYKAEMNKMGDDQEELLDNYRDNFLFICRLTNLWLSAVDAAENEKYLI